MKILTKQRLTAASNPIIDLCANSIHTFLNQFSYLKPFNASASQMTIDQLFDYCTKSKNGIEFENKLDKNVTSLITKYGISLDKISTNVSAFAKFVPQNKTYIFTIEYYIHYDYDAINTKDLEHIAEIYDTFLDPFYSAIDALDPITKSLRTTNSDINIDVNFYTETPKPSYAAKSIEITAKPTKELLDSQVYTYLPVLKQFQSVVDAFIDNLKGNAEVKFAKEYAHLYERILKTRRRGVDSIGYGYFMRDNLKTSVEISGIKTGKYTLCLEFRAFTKYIEQKWGEKPIEFEVDNIEEVQKAVRNMAKAMLKTKQFAKSNGFRIIEENLDMPQLKLVIALPR